MRGREGTEYNKINHALIIIGAGWWINELFFLVFRMSEIFLKKKVNKTKIATGWMRQGLTVINWGRHGSLPDCKGQCGEPKLEGFWAAGREWQVLELERWESPYACSGQPQLLQHLPILACFSGPEKTHRERRCCPEGKKACVEESCLEPFEDLFNRAVESGQDQWEQTKGSQFNLKVETALTIKNAKNGNR